MSDSKERIIAFPDTARRESGHQLDQVPKGLNPDNWKPMKSVGPGVREIRISSQGQFRIIYIATFEDAVYVLHAFKKTTRKTPKADIELAKSRLKEVRREQEES